MCGLRSPCLCFVCLDRTRTLQMIVHTCHLYATGHLLFDSRIHTIPYRPPRAVPCCCQRCRKDKQSPKLFSDNNMDPGSVPPLLQGLTQTEEILIARCNTIMRGLHFKGGQLGYGGHVVNVAQDHHVCRYPPQACRRCAHHHHPERGAGARPAQGPTRAEGSRATGSVILEGQQPVPPRRRP